MNKFYFLNIIPLVFFLFSCNIITGNRNTVTADSSLGTDVPLSDWLAGNWLLTDLSVNTAVPIQLSRAGTSGDSLNLYVLNENNIQDKQVQLQIKLYKIKQSYFVCVFDPVSEMKGFTYYKMVKILDDEANFYPVEKYSRLESARKEEALSYIENNIGNDNIFNFESIIHLKRK